MDPRPTDPTPADPSPAPLRPADPTPTPRPPSRWAHLRWPILTGIVALAVVGVLALLVNIFERQSEARDPFYRVAEITDTTQNAATWGKNFPLQYDDYLKTVDQERTRYGGSEAMPHTPTDVDPRSEVAQSRLDEDPRLREFWAGYAFSKDFREERGHAYMLLDQEFTERQRVVQQPGTCINCHASAYVPYLRLGNGDLQAGFDRLNRMPYHEARTQVRHPVSCIDCHTPQTMELRITRPAFMEGMRVLKASQGVDDYDVNRDASRQEMRSFVCGQCHVEYYFKGPEKRLTYPWARGLHADSILAYYEADGHRDWTHQVSGARVNKAQHPEFELFNQGVHAKAGVACADCHMPYKRTGAMKVSDHWVRSPMLNIAAACQTCHRWPEEELRQRVHTIQDRTYELRNIALDATLDLTRAIAAVARRDSAAPTLAAARLYQFRAQFMTDFIEAENSMGFHADQEAARVLGNAINYARLGSAALRGEDVRRTATRYPAPPQVVSPGTAPGAARRTSR